MKRIFPFLLIFILIFGCIYAEEPDNRQREALRQLIERAESGDAKAMYDLARLLENGYDTLPKDSLRSLALYMESASKGYAPAQNYIGFKYYNGDGVQKDIDSSLFWIRSAAEAGDITAAANLGYLLTDSPDIPHDEEEALKWLTIASEVGVPEAQMKLVGLMKEKWETLPPDSALYLGVRYYTGRAPIAGTKLLEIAANQNISKAKAMLGDAFSKGLGVPYDHQKSIDYFFEAAQEGDPSAQFIIGEMLEIFPDALDNKGIRADQIESSSQYWFQKSESQGVNDAESAYEKLFSLP